jgi:hypothetical protein
MYSESVLMEITEMDGSVILEVFSAKSIQIVVVWPVIPYSLGGGYQRFGGTCCLHLQCRNNAGILM